MKTRSICTTLQVDLKAAAGILGEKTADQLLKVRCDENLEVADPDGEF